MKAPALLFPTLRGYQASWARRDVLAGVGLASTAIPAQIATAHLADMPALTGLYAFIAGSALFALFGRHPWVSVGADSTIAPVFAASVAVLVPVGSADYKRLVSSVAVVAGGVLVVAGVARLGWVADFFPLPVVTGALSGIGVIVLVHQLPDVLGVPGGATTTIGRLRAVVDQLGQVNFWAVGIAAGVLAVIGVAVWVDQRIPGALAAVVGATALVATTNLVHRGVRVVGTVHAEFPRLGWPGASLSQIGKLAETAVTVAFVCVVQTSAAMRANRAASHGPRDFDWDLVGLGAGSVLAGFAGSFAVDASPPQTAVARSAGAKSQLSSLVAVAVVVAVAASGSSLLKDLPEAALGAILVYIAFRLFRVREMVAIWRFGWYEFALAIVTLLVVVFFGVEQGVVASALLAVAERLRVAARPRDAVLGRQPGTDHWIETDVGLRTEQVPGVVVYLLYASIWYGNADHVVERILAAVDGADGPVRQLVLDANGMADVDYTGAKTLGQMVAELSRRGIRVSLARASHLVHHDLKHAGLLEAISADEFFPSVEEAVRSAAAASPGSSPGSSAGSG